MAWRVTPELPGDLGLGEPLVDQCAQQVPALGVELLGQAHVPDGLVPDLPQALEGLLMGRDVWLLFRHAFIMTTEGCRVKWGLSWWPAHSLMAPSPVRMMYFWNTKKMIATGMVIASAAAS